MGARFTIALAGPRVTTAPPLIIGLTGGIGAGKSTVARLFAAQGVPIRDADDISRELVMPDSPYLAPIVSYFGEAVLTTAGELNRAHLRQRIFADPAAKHWLEALLHPPIFARLHAWALTQTTPYVILMIPLLIETGQRAQVDRVLVIDTTEALQLQRIVERDRIPLAQANAILQQQCPRAQRLAAADDVIVNDGDTVHLTAAVARCHEQYLQLSRARFFS